MSTRVVPKQFHQLKLAGQITVFMTGLIVGSRQRVLNRREWDAAEKKKWAENAARQSELRAAEAAKMPKLEKQPPMEGPLGELLLEAGKVFEEAQQ